MRLMMIRHPISEANVRGIVYHNQAGRVHERGYEQIQKLLRRLSEESFDYVYSSDADRCKILAEEISKSKAYLLFIILNLEKLITEIGMVRLGKT